MPVGTIQKFRMSGGLLGLQLEHADGSRTWVWGDWRPTMQALEAIFPNIKLQDVLGVEVAYSLTSYGALATLADPEAVDVAEVLSGGEETPA